MSIPLCEAASHFTDTLMSLERQPGLFDGDLINFTVFGRNKAKFTQSYRWRTKRPSVDHHLLADDKWVEILQTPIHP